MKIEFFDGSFICEGAFQNINGKVMLVNSLQRYIVKFKLTKDRHKHLQWNRHV